MHNRSTIVTIMLALLSVAGMTSCKKTTVVGMKPVLEIVSQPGYVNGDTTLDEDKKYHIQISASRSEEKSDLAYFDVTRTYSGGADTSVYYQVLSGADAVNFNYTHTFTTLKKPGTERYTFTVKNVYGIVNQKIIVVTVK